MIKKITSKQQRVLSFYQAFIQKNKYPPTYQEAAAGLEVSPSVVFTHIKNLEKRGYLATSSSERSVQITSENVSIPLLGSVACGEPISIYEECSEYIDVPKSFIKSGMGNSYALIASGKSMIKAGIDSGDILIVRQQNDVDDGDIAVVAVGEDAYDEKATLKRVYHHAEKLILAPENDEFPRTIVKNGKIRGKLTGVIRKY